ncbi:MAG: SDR family oxidoreductase [Deltaproteobacteria bacterium]|nr:SDR family oxidoreductase [Deltaproteobacteria bacterium]
MLNVLITGANRGIGLELSRQFSERGDQVIAVCRNSSPGLDELHVGVISGIDVRDDSSVKSLAKKLSGRRIDILINNAGILQSDSLDKLDFESMKSQFDVNALGPLRVSSALLPNLKKGSKLIVITSRMGSIADNSSGAYYGYRMSKAALNMAAMNLARDLYKKSISVGILHPGMVATKMTGGQGISPVESVRGLINRIEALGLKKSGTFWHANGEELPW